jgi:hypothetical protein
VNDRSIKVPTWLAAILVSSILAGMASLQVWTVKEISALKVTVAGIGARMDSTIASDKHLASTH